MSKLFPLALLLGVVYAQVPLALDEELIIHSDVEETLVEINVTDAKGRPVLDLKPEDIFIYDNEVLRPVADLRREESLPLTIGLIVDLSGSQLENLNRNRDSISEFVRQVLHAQDRVFLVGVDSEVRLITDLTSSPEALRDGVTSITPAAPPGHVIGRPCGSHNGRLGTCGGTALWKALEDAGQVIFSKLEGRKALIVITDGLDTGTSPTLSQVIREMQELNTAVYTIRYDGSAVFKSVNERVKRDLIRLSDETGALSVKAPMEGLAGPFAEIERELRSRYLAIFHVPPNAHDGEFHQLRVETRRKGLKVRSRAGYRASK